MSHRRLLVKRAARLTGCAAVVVLGVTGCGSGRHAPAAVAHPAGVVKASRAAPSPITTPDPYAPSVKKAPNLSADGTTTVVSGANVKGSATYAIPGGMKAGKTLAIATYCQGSGRLDVRVQPVGTVFSIACEENTVLPVLNEMGVYSKHPTASLSVTTQPDITWSFTVGWDPHPPEQQ
jgi:hypothetical protein